jgi:hypothetical protein
MMVSDVKERHRCGVWKRCTVTCLERIVRGRTPIKSGVEIKSVISVELVVDSIVGGVDDGIIQVFDARLSIVVISLETVARARTPVKFSFASLQN